MIDYSKNSNLDTEKVKNPVVSSPLPHSDYNEARTRRPRVALYSHDSMGLGHIRRNLAIAEALVSCNPRPVILMITGSREIGAFSLPPGVDSVTLPALYKEEDGTYRSRCLDVTLKEILRIREKTIKAALDAFSPDVLIVDKEPLGAVGELAKALDSLNRRGHTRCVLGLRDVIDDPVAVQIEWSLHNNYQAIRRYYDAVWVYGDPFVYDMVREYQFPDDIALMTRYTGYLGHTQSYYIDGRDKGFTSSVELSLEKLVLCMVGGGQDGAQLARTFAEIDIPPDTYCLLLTGPHMPDDIRQWLHANASVRSNFGVIDFTIRPLSLMQQADCIITMGGYNTIYETLFLKKRILVVPRVSPRQEQLIRAARMKDLGLLDMLHPDMVTPAALNGWLSSNKTQTYFAAEKIDLQGLARIPGLLSDVLNASPEPAEDDLARSF